MPTKAKTKTKADIFICKRKRGGYWAFPSPFVAHGARTKIQFRNLTDDAIKIDFGRAQLQPKTLTLAPRTKAVVQVDPEAPPGLHQYVATVVGKGGIAARLASGKPIVVKGGSPPEIIIDT